MKKKQKFKLLISVMENQKIKSNKNFGITFSIFLLITIYIFINYGKTIINLWLLSAKGYFFYFR